MTTTYIITRSDELYHEGVKGMHWGERRWQYKNGSLTPEGRKHYGVAEGGSRRMSRQFNREMKKLNKLHDNADVDVQRQKAAQYDKRVKTGLKVAGVGAAIAGAGAAAEYGGANLRNNLVSKALNASRESEQGVKDFLSKQFHDEWSFWEDQRRNLDGVKVLSRDTLDNIYRSNQDKAFVNYFNSREAIESAGKAKRDNINAKAGLASQIHKGVMAAGAATAVVGGGIAAYNKVQSSLAKRRMTDVGHDKAVAKYEAQVNKMMDMFKNTPYSNLIKKSA